MSNFEIKEFPQEVIDGLEYYVYKLVDPRNGETFYIGKGQGNRIFEHLKCAIQDDIQNEEDANLDPKYQRIREIKSSGLEVIHIIHRHGLDDKTASHVEAALIDAFPGTTNIAGGYCSNEIGPMHAFEILNKYKAEIAKLDHKVIMININRTINTRDLYDAVRFAWKLNVEKARKADFILAVDKGIIVGVYKANEWQLAIKQYFPEFENHTDKRYGFIGEEANEEIQNLYSQKRIPDDYRKKGASNPIKYNYE